MERIEGEAVERQKIWMVALPDIEIREATAEDAEPVCAVLRLSITELCVADHRNDPDILERWLRNKTPEKFASWLRQADSSVMLAVKDGTVLAVGAANDGGEITLNYVSPSARFRGVSRALLAALEARVVERGNSVCTLWSTVTARRFYLSARYVETAAPSEMFGLLSYPMAKRLNQ